MDERNLKAMNTTMEALGDEELVAYGEDVANHLSAYFREELAAVIEQLANRLKVRTEKENTPESPEVGSLRWSETGGFTDG